MMRVAGGRSVKPTMRIPFKDSRHTLVYAKVAPKTRARSKPIILFLGGGRGRGLRSDLGFDRRAENGSNPHGTWGMGGWSHSERAAGTPLAEKALPPFAAGQPLFVIGDELYFIGRIDTGGFGDGRQEGMPAIRFFKEGGDEGTLVFIQLLHPRAAHARAPKRFIAHRGGDDHLGFLAKTAFPEPSDDIEAIDLIGQRDVQDEDVRGVF